MALRFPFAPDAAQADKTVTSPAGSVRSRRSGISDDDADDTLMEQFLADNPWLSSPLSSAADEGEAYGAASPPSPGPSVNRRSDEFEGLEGIYRFLEECDRPRPRF